MTSTLPNKLLTRLHRLLTKLHKLLLRPSRLPLTDKLLQ